MYFFKQKESTFYLTSSHYHRSNDSTTYSIDELM